MEIEKLSWEAETTPLCCNYAREVKVGETAFIMISGI